MVLFGELFSLCVIRRNLRPDHGAVALRILRLDDSDWMRITPGAGRQDEADSHDRKHSGARDGRSPKYPSHRQELHPDVLEMFYAT
jgi:hypothetical protein